MLFGITISNLFSQNIYEDVYTIFQNSCMPCHSTATQNANLNLEGIGNTMAEKMADVYANIYKKTPQNSTASNNKNFLIYPGDPYRSFLYRKIDNGLTAGLTLHNTEGTSMPQYGGGTSLSEKETELIRQWILYGAQDTGVYFDKTLLESYYDNGGIESVPNPPAPPAAGEGFQIHLGPFYLEPSGEIEYFSKYESLLNTDLEVYKLQTIMGDFSHHFIVYKFSNLIGNVNPDLVPYGMREQQDFDGREFVSVDQYSNTLNLPNGSAFLWKNNTILDLNSHYINYSSTQVLKCEVYYNVYTQTEGTANQIMNVALIPNTDIPIPNDNIPVTFNYDFQLAADIDIFIWGMVAHTHQYGKDFNIYRKNPDGSRKDQIYDGGCANGLPGCSFEDFDYTHLPIRFFSPFIDVNVQDGLEAEATFQNNGPVSVDWGLTSQDEMMIFVVFYVTDTTGIEMEDPIIIESIDDKINIKDFSIFPNPTKNIINFVTNNDIDFDIEIFDISARKIISKNCSSKTNIDVSKWQKGIYFFKIISNNNEIIKGKFIKK